MAKRNRIKLETRFPQAKRGGHDAVNKAVEEALIVGQETAQSKIEAAVGKTGYDLDPFVVRRKNFGDAEGGMVFIHSDNWYYRFFEYGTVFISATPFLRPTHRKMRKTFEEELGDKFEGYVRRRVGKV